MPRLNKTQEYAILWLRNQGHCVEEISKETGATIKQISSVFEKNPGPETPDSMPEPAPKTSKDFMIKQTAAKNNRGVSIMTEAASQMNDAARKNYSSNTNKNSDYIHRIS